MNRLFCLLIIGGAVSLAGCSASSTTAGQVSMFDCRGNHDRHEDPEV